MGIVTIKLPPKPDQVRTARLLAVSVARRAGVAETLIDEVRLAVGEACARAVQVHIAGDVTEPVVVVLSNGLGFEVVVTDSATRTAAPVQRLPLGVHHRGEDDPASIGLTVLAAVVDDVSIEAIAPIGTRVRMRWPIATSA